MKKIIKFRKKQQEKILKKEKKKETKENRDIKEEQKDTELVLELIKIDGYCFRTIKEEQNLTENKQKKRQKLKKLQKKMILFL